MAMRDTGPTSVLCIHAETLMQFAIGLTKMLSYLATRIRNLSDSVVGVVIRVEISQYFEHEADHKTQI
jgi:hypothetical protein